LRIISPDWLRTSILLISASCVAGITGVNYQHPTVILVFETMSHYVAQNVLKVQILLSAGITGVHHSAWLLPHNFIIILSSTFVPDLQMNKLRLRKAKTLSQIPKAGQRAELSWAWWYKFIIPAFRKQGQRD
jgi:hypothetical protein